MITFAKAVKSVVSVVVALLTALGVIGGENKEGLLGYLYNTEEHYFYTADEAWQSNFGFNSLYDTVAPATVMFYDTVRFRFEYEEKDWMIQMWRGQYGWVFLGAEIGVYNKPTDRKLMHYDAVDEEDWLTMQFTLTRFGFWDIIETQPKHTWWCTGFVPGSLVNMLNQDQLSMNANITVKDKKMLKAFTAAVEEQSDVCSYTVDGLTVNITF